MHLKYVVYAGGRPSHDVAKGYGARRTFVVLRGGMFDPQEWTLPITQDIGSVMPWM